MPQRIPFHVVYATSEDSSYPACELNSQGPAARGWRSAGPAPHELLLRLASVASLHRLQLLAHHQLIPASVEVLVSGGLVSEGAATPCGAAYSSVGRVALAQPASQPHARELRSASLPEPTIARFVKLKLSGPHPPAHENDQVALMAINVLGEELDSPTEAPSPADAFCAYDDLAFIMYVDNEIADLVRRLDQKKRTAVTEERFEYARRLKSASTALSSAGARVGRWRLRKRTAAARDDFELARRMRDRICDALEGIQSDQELLRLFEEYGPDPRNDSSMPQEYDFSHHLSPSVLPGILSVDIPSPVPPIDQVDRGDREEFVNGQEVVEEIEAESPEPPIQESIPSPPLPAPTEETVKKVTSVESIKKVVEIERIEDKVETYKREEEDVRRETDSPRRSITPNAANGGALVRRRNKSAGPRSTFEAYEESLLPALRHSHTNEYLRDAKEEDCSTGSVASHSRAPPHKLNERERKQAALPILIFGYPLVEKFYSKAFLDKEDGLSRLKSELTSLPPGNCRTSPNKTARAAAILLQRVLRDKVFSVYSKANEVVLVLFKEFVPDRVCAAEVTRCLEKILPELLRACGDPAPRVHNMAQHTVLSIADVPQVRSTHVIPQQLVRPCPGGVHPRLALSRLLMLEQLALSHGIASDKNSVLTVRRLAECGAAGAAHAAGSVRAAAERVLLLAYERSPRVVRAQLPPDDAVTRRNLMYRHLFHQFDRIDMQKMLNQASSEEPCNDQDQSIAESSFETASISQSSRSALSLMTSSMSVPSSYSLKSLASQTSGSTLAPSSLSGSYTTKSSLKKSPTKRYTPSKCVRDFANSPGYNKLRLDSAVSPKHSPRSSSAGNEKVHFQKPSDEVVYRRTHRNSENRHSMIHYDHDSSKPLLKERPVTVYEPLHVDYRASPTLGSPKASKNDLRSLDSLPLDSPQLSRCDLRRDSDCRSLDSPKIKRDYFGEAGLESPRLVAGVRSLHLEDSNNQMEESGYYSPGRRQTESAEQFDSYDGPTEAHEISADSNTTTTCSWCNRVVRVAALAAHQRHRCAVLARCPHCRAAVSARSLHRHLLQECTMSEGFWKECRRCGAALRTEEKDMHANCIPLGLEEWKCPYCYTNVLARDLPWIRHLMQCPRNPRLHPTNNYEKQVV